MNIKILNININNIKICYLVWSLIVASVFFYVYLINSMAFDTVKYKKAVENILITESQISDLEFSLLAKDKEINRELAGKFDLTKNVEKEALFVVRSENTKLTLNNE